MKLFLLFTLLILVSCSTNNKTPKPLGTIYKILTGDLR